MNSSESKSKRQFSAIVESDTEEVTENISSSDLIENENLKDKSLSPMKKMKKIQAQAIKTFCRIRPTDQTNDIFKIKENSGDKILIVQCDPTLLKKLNTPPSFTFSKTFDEKSSQIDVFESTCQNLVEDLLKKKKSGLIFTYGMTNAGKTWTVIGSPSSPGILPSSLKYLYSKYEESQLSTQEPFDIFCNFVEIYNEDVFDLLANPGVNDKKEKLFKKKLSVKENNKRLFFLPEVFYQKILNIEDFNCSLAKGIIKKTHSATNLNQNSSRSHTIFKIILKPKNSEEEVSLSIVDLAGSERANKSGVQGKELLEACQINLSLSVLGKCMEAMKHNSLYVNKKIVPYRESKLTMLFQEYFQGDQNVIMITNINPRREDFEETIRALNYSCIAKEINPIKSRIVTVNPKR